MLKSGRSVTTSAHETFQDKYQTSRLYDLWLYVSRLSQPHYFSMTRRTSSTLLLAQAIYFLEFGSGQVWMMVGILWLELKTIWCVCRNSNEMENEEGNDIYINVWCILIFSPFASENLTPGNCREIDNLPNTKYFTQKSFHSCKREKEIGWCILEGKTHLRWKGEKSVLSRMKMSLNLSTKNRVIKIQCWKLFSSQHCTVIN